MPKNHARKIALTGLKTRYGVTHTDAIALLDNHEAQERELLCGVIATYTGVTTYKAALATLEQLRSHPLWEAGEDLEVPDCYLCAYGDNPNHCCECGASIDYECVCWDRPGLGPDPLADVDYTKGGWNTPRTVGGAASDADASLTGWGGRR